MIKHSINWEVLTPYTPGISIDERLIEAVNKEYIVPIITEFFQWKGIDNYESLDVDKLKTEIEFEHELDFVKNYVYEELFKDIHKTTGNNKVQTSTKFIVTFDRDIARTKALVNYPPPHNKPIQYGVIELGGHPILYYIWINFQQLIRFIKTKKLSAQSSRPLTDPFETKGINKRFENAINKRILELQQERNGGSLTEQRRKELSQQVDLLKQSRSSSWQLKGKTGSLRVNLTWNTIDDLDLHVKLPNGDVINYKKKEVVCEDKVGILDLDANAGTSLTSSPQENIYWENPPEGIFEVSVQLYRKRTTSTVSFQITIFRNDLVTDLGGGRVMTHTIQSEKESILITKFDYSKSQSLRFLS